MKIKNVPYICDDKEEYASCQGPPTLMMVLKHFLPEIELSFDELYKKLSYSKGEWFFETYMVELLNKLKIPTKYYSTKELTTCSDPACFKELSGLDLNNEEHKQEVNLKHYNSSVKYLINKNLFCQKKNLDMRFIKEQINHSRLIIAVINRNKYINKEGYKGHFILIKGYTKDSLICNDAYFGEEIIIPFNKFLELFYTINWAYPEDKTKYSRDLITIG